MVKKFKPTEFHYFTCMCGDAEHTLRFVYVPEYGDLNTEVYLRQYRRWYKRLWLAIKYVFGYQSKYGAFDCTMLQREEYDKLRDLLNRSEKRLQEIDDELKKNMEKIRQDLCGSTEGSDKRL